MRAGTVIYPVAHYMTQVHILYFNTAYYRASLLDTARVMAAAVLHYKASGVILGDTNARTGRDEWRATGIVPSA